MPGVFPGQNRIRLVLPFPKIRRTRESDTRSQSYGCLKFFLTVELWKFITNCRKIQINWNLCQFCVFFNALHAGVITFSVWFLYQSRLANLLAEVKFDVFSALHYTSGLCLVLGCWVWTWYHTRGQSRVLCAWTEI